MLDRPLPDPLDYLQQVMADGDFIVLTGAGISTPSGIPDYRDTDGVRRGRQPMMYQEFLAAPESRRRYWARAMLGWPRVRQAQPNAAHEALASLQSHGRIGGLITQNVDTLHDQAGSHDVVELHGSLHRVLCLDCGQRSERDSIQQLMETQNPYLAGVDAARSHRHDLAQITRLNGLVSANGCKHIVGDVFDEGIRCNRGWRSCRYRHSIRCMSRYSPDRQQGGDQNGPFHILQNHAP